MKLLVFILLTCSLFSFHPQLSQAQKEMMAPHLLPADHALKPALDSICSKAEVFDSEQSLTDAGFQIIASVTGSFTIVARHPLVPGYVFKLYLNGETRLKQYRNEETGIKEEMPNCEWLALRCIGAQKIRKVIKKKKIKHFAVPDKWLYVLPAEAKQPVLLVATDMEIENEPETVYAWKNRVTQEHLDELYEIIKHGYGTLGLVRNIPYTKKGIFAFTDTEYPKRHFKLKKIKPYLSGEMQDYWDTKIIR